MKFEVNVFGVDGETNVSMHAMNAAAIRRFLTKHDHEGSGVQLHVTADDGEAYDVLTALEHFATDNSARCANWVKA
jgi:hypothetical protein